MQIMSDSWNADITALARNVIGKVELYDGSTLLSTFLHDGELSSIQVERTAVNGSFFGYSICQKATVTLLDREGSISVSKGNIIKVFLGTESEFACAPDFIVSEAAKDEVKKTLTITAYDLMESAAAHSQTELRLEYPITVRGYADAIASSIGTSVVWEVAEGNTLADIEYNVEVPEAGLYSMSKAEISGTDTLRDVLVYIAQVTGTICFMNKDNCICFKQLEAAPTFSLDKTVYFNMDVGKEVRLSSVVGATELGDNLIAGEQGGKTQVLYNNMFLENNDDAPEILNQLFAMYSDVSMRPYNVRWRGNPALEFGDCVRITLADNTTADIFYLGETLTYNGGMVSMCEWQDEIGEESVDATPTTVGDILKLTYAKVDKINAEIDLVARRVDENYEAISSIKLDADSINASVESIRKETSEAIEGVNESIETLSNRVDLQITPEQLQIEIQAAIDNGVSEITTSTGYTFDENGMTVSKQDSPMSTQITEDGMTVSHDDEVRLVANSDGVIARNLHAETYLRIGLNSRFEDYNDNERTGCFWVGETIEEDSDSEE